jgi:leucyl aminopeptidase
MLQLTPVDLKKEKIETLIVPVCEDKVIHTDKTVAGLIRKAKRLKEFKGASKEEVTFYNPSEIKAERITFIGLGKRDKIDLENLRSMAGKAVKSSMAKTISEIFIAVPDATRIKIDEAEILKSLGEGAVLGNHLYRKYKEEKKLKPLKRVHFVVEPEVKKNHSGLLQRVESVCSGTIQAREWVNTPSNEKKPEQFAGFIRAAAGKTKLRVSIMNDKQLKQKKFDSLLAVAAGSESKPRMVTLEHRPPGAKKTIALIGKGVTFDSGGLNLKPSGSLETMKSDMSGAAVVASTMIAISKLKPKINVVGLIPIVENMLSGSATRPGDIVRSYSGKTVEINNTDAEGRLILIDAMAYAVKTYKPQALIDLATLTGACVVALGERIAGVFSSDDELAESILQSGAKTHERCWKMPLPDDYKEMLKSDFADISNVGGTRWGGAITAALFLSEFVEDIPWAHIDIAGPSYSKKGSGYCGPGGTGFGVRLLCDLLENM